MSSAKLDSCLNEWRSAIGDTFVRTEPAILERAETATYKTAQRIPAVLSPATRSEVQQCLHIANKYGVPVYPISSGKNWGYGSRVPPGDGSALIDLGRLDKIVEFSEELGYVTVEPGVTQKQLYSFLRQKGSRLWMDATGSSPQCSLIGNTMERGFGHTPMGDHFAHVCGLEVVLPDGTVVETGAARLPGSLTASVNRWGVGPSIDGLFSQSNLGIVTRMTIWLMPEPDAFEAFFFRCPDHASLPELIDVIRDLRLREILRSSIHIGNDYKVLAGLQPYPWNKTDGKTPLGPELMAKFRSKLGFGSWNASGGLYGTKAQVNEAKGILRKTFAKQSGTLKFLSPKTLRLAKKFAHPFRMLTGWDLNKTVELVEPVLGLMQGVPTEQPLKSAYWRKRFEAPAEMDPDRDRCGLLWYAPVAPALGHSVEALTDLTSNILLRFGFEPMISLTFLTARLISCVVSISYDRDVPGEDETAAACHDELVRACSERGYYPYRLGIKSMNQITEREEYADLLGRLKTALDPQGILAPGRYDPRGSAVSDPILERS
ncbi:MAG: FAD-binding oxidoreductase [Acidobacteriaceae bacterium]|nr:FAD-binding oxidoreductase [Acidobacteriaceae bacterium]